VEEVALRVVEGGEDLHVDHPVLLSQLLVKVRGSLTGELAVEDDDVSLLLIVWVVVRGGWQSSLGDESLEKSLVFAVLPVLCPVDMTSLVLEIVSHINDPEALDTTAVLAGEYLGKSVTVDGAKLRVYSQM